MTFHNFYPTLYIYCKQTKTSLWPLSYLNCHHSSLTVLHYPSSYTQYSIIIIALTSSSNTLHRFVSHLIFWFIPSFLTHWGRLGPFKLFKRPLPGFLKMLTLLNVELNPICYLLALLAHHFLHVSKIRVKSLLLRLLMSYLYGAPILDVSGSHKTTHHSR